VEYFRKLIAGVGLVGPDSLDKWMKKTTSFIIFTLLVCMVGPAFGDSDGRQIDRAHSTITVYVYKTGILSTLAHNHEIEAPIESAEIKGSENSAVELRVDASKLRVLDAEVSADTQAKIQATMQGAEVLDVGRFPEIHFQSTGVEPSGTDHWIIHGSLDLHGQTHPISFEVALKNGLYEGTAVLKQSAFGITPVRVAGGTVKIKDEIKVAFSIALLK
jgi:polyisoprenoid-binding protein YceI